MNFTEAVKELKSGNKIARSSWKDQYLQLTDDHQVKSYTLVANIFTWTNDIILSNDWIIDGIENCSFTDALAALNQGKKIKLSNWDDEYVEFDIRMTAPLFRSYDVNLFTTTYQDFIAEDWIILN